MIQIAPQMRIILAIQPVDFRKGIDGLAGIMKGFAMDPMNGYLFIFRNRSGTSLKALSYDGQGFGLYQKRLSKGRFRFWPKEKEPLTSMAAHELQALLWNNDPDKMDAPMWKPLT